MRAQKRRLRVVLQSRSPALLALALWAVSWAPAADAHEMGASRVDALFTADGQYRIETRIDPETTLRRLQLDAGDPVSEAPHSAEELEELLLERRGELLQAFAIRFDGQAVAPRLDLLTVETAPGPPEAASSSAGGSQPADPFPSSELSPEALLQQLSRVPGLEATLRLGGSIPAGASTFSLRYSLPSTTYALALHDERFGLVGTQWLEGDATSEPFDLTGVSPSRFDVARQYIVLGFTHILPKGLDHILFVLGIFLLSTRLRPILAQVTAFTVAHTLTLGLSIYGIVSLPSTVVEPLIALSIVYVAVENILTRELSPWRVLIVFCFGLLHGLGFAGVLQDLGLPRSGFITALITFNIGVELGQLAVIALAFGLVASWARTRPWYRQRIVIPASVAIAMVGLFWTLQRVF